MSARARVRACVCVRVCVCVCLRVSNGEGEGGLHTGDVYGGRISKRLLVQEVWIRNRRTHMVNTSISNERNKATGSTVDNSA